MNERNEDHPARIVCRCCCESKPYSLKHWYSRSRHGDDWSGFCRDCNDTVKPIDYLTRRFIKYPGTTSESAWTIEVFERGAHSAPISAKVYDVEARPDNREFVTAFQYPGDPKLLSLAMIAHLDCQYALRDRLKREAAAHPLYAPKVVA